MAVIKSQFTMRLDPVTHYKIKQIAAHERRSLTNMIEYLVTKEIRSFEEENGEILYTDDDLYKE